jgi:hypothetical protein
MAHATCPDRLAVPLREKAHPFDGFVRFARRLAARWNASDEAEIRRTLARSGGRITDSMERELMQRTLDASWRGRY